MLQSLSAPLSDLLFIAAPITKFYACRLTLSATYIWPHWLPSYPASSRVFQPNVYINQFVTLDNACSPEASLAWAKSDDVWTFARCTNNVWRAVSGPIGATLGRPCATEGAQAQNSTSTGLICTGGKWISLTGRIGQYAAIDKYKAVNGDSVYKPVCASGVPYATAIPSVIDQQSQQSNIIRLFNSDDRWLIQVVNDLNESILDAEVIVETYCYMRP